MATGQVSNRELAVSAAVGAVFGLLGYFATRHVYMILDRKGWG